MDRILTFSTFVGICAIASCFFVARHTQAQVSGQAFVDSYILNRPTVSPYLNLLRPTGFSGVTNYQTLVRPQIEQRELARIQQAELNRVRQQVSVQQQSIDTIQQQRAQRVFSTGHRTQFMNTQNYYPGFAELRRR